MPVRKRGPTQYQARIRVKGYPPLERVFPTQELAELWEAEQRLAMMKGAWVSMKEADSTTMSEALDRYAREITPGKKGAAQELTRIRRIQGSWIALKPLSAVRGVDVARYRDELAERLAPNTVRLKLAIISHLYTIAIKEWGMEGLSNPVGKVRKPKVQNAREYRVLPEIEQRLLELADPVMKGLIVLAVETAMRRSELVGLRRDDVAGRVVRLKETKNGVARSVPLSRRAVAALADLPLRLDGSVFGIAVGTASHRFARLAAAIGKPDLHFHDLRHEGTSRLFEKGLSLMEVASITGHKDPKMLNRYTHLQPQAILEKLE